MAEILIVDDDENMCSAFRQFLEAEGHTPIIASSAADAVNSVSEKHPDLVFMDIRMPGVDGLEALKQIRALAPNIYVVVMTAYSTSQTSIEAVRLGAFDYLHKPLDLDDVRHVIEKALAAQTLSRKAAALETNEWERYSLVNLVGSSLKMREIYKLIGLLTTNDVPVLIHGERGVGKQLVAQTIHFNSMRKDRPFVTVNCQTVQAEAIEAEIFGRAAAGGSPAHAGRLEKAAGGTLFIDEIGYLPTPAQNKLLRYLKEKTYEQSGGAEALSADVRIIAATGQELGDHTQMFNVELYDTLRLITIELPPLRDRRQDIPELVNHFARRHSNELHKAIKGIDDRVLELLREHPWAGNVAELENVIKRACILTRGDVITVDDVVDALQGGPTLLPAEVQSALETAAREALQQKLLDQDGRNASSVFYEIVSHVETTLVREALRITGGNQVKAAELLGLNRTTLRKKMEN
jgi:DNA-binding NtrC family response regulator